MAYTAEHGGMTNAYTGLDITNYMMQVDNEAFPEALDRFSSFFTDPLLDPTYIDKEEERGQCRMVHAPGAGFRITYRLSRKPSAIIRPIDFRLAIWSRWPIKLRVGCTTLLGVFRATLQRQLDEGLLVGNLPLAELRQLAKEHFGDIPNKQVDRPRTTAELNFAVAGAKRVRYRPQDDTRELRLDFIMMTTVAVRHQAK